MYECALSSFPLGLYGVLEVKYRVGFKRCQSKPESSLRERAVSWISAEENWAVIESWRCVVSGTRWGRGVDQL
jgi:hypothetical protein